MVSKKTQKQIKYRRMLEAKEDKHYNKFTDHELVVTINRCVGILKERLIRGEFINFNVTTKKFSILKQVRYKKSNITNSGPTTNVVLETPLEPVTKTYITEDGLPF
jgi:hypothetical protein|tara:strand:+ start:228 stop:545 length:318 start_codon:yes stop_codon:yes gene_type:complete